MHNEVVRDETLAFVPTLFCCIFTYENTTKNYWGISKDVQCRR